MSETELLLRPPWYRLIKRRRWERLFGKALAIEVYPGLVEQVEFNRRKKRQMRGVVGG